MAEKEGFHLPWQKADDPEPQAPEATLQELQAREKQRAREKHEAEAKAELKEKQAKIRHEAKAHPEVPAHQAAATERGAPQHPGKPIVVEIESVTLNPATREVAVHGTVSGKAAAARFTEGDLLGLETVKARQEYVARHLASVAAVGVPDPPAHLDLAGRVHLG